MTPMKHIINLKMKENKEIIMMNLSNVFEDKRKYKNHYDEFIK